MPRERAARFAQLDGLRALAAFAVFATHIALQTGFTARNALGPLTARLNVGVTLFFVLSAFLLYRPIVAARLDGAGRPRVRRYATRRVLRILPAYWVALLILGLTAGELVPGALGAHWWAFFGLAQVYSFGTAAGGIGVAWSLSTEAAFYVALPLFAALAWRLLRAMPRERQVRWELAAIAVSAAAAFVLREIAGSGHWMATFDNTLPGTWPWFAAGLALAVTSAAWPPRSAAAAPWVLRAARDHAWWWWAAAAALLAFTAFGGVLPRQVFFMTHAQLQLEMALYAVFALLVMTPLVAGPEARRSPAALLSTRPAVWLGMVSYGIFLWHLPVIGWVLAHPRPSGLPLATLEAAAITLPLAAASWYLVERPAMRLGTRARSRPDRDPSARTPVLEPAP